MRNPWLRLHLICFPAACRACGSLLHPLGAAHGGFPFLCERCHEELPWQDRPLWAHPLRHQPGPVPTDAGMGHSGTAGALRRVWAVWEYEEPVVRWIWALKYQGRDALAVTLGRLLARRSWAAEPLQGVDAVVPVPLHRGRLRGRGFNQALLVAHHWLRGLAREAGDDGRGARSAPLPPLRPRWLERHRATRPQMSLSAQERAINVQGAFTAVPPRWRVLPGRPAPEELLGKRVLLVDDVMTTGATLSECAAALRAAGAAAVDALVLARIEDAHAPLQPPPEGVPF